MKDHALRASIWKLLGLLPLVTAVLASQPAVAQEGNCINDVTGRLNTCNAGGDVQLSSFVNDEDTACMPGEPVTLNLTVRLLATSLERYDIGLFLALDGGGADTGSCRHDYLPPPLALGGTCSLSGQGCKKDVDCPLGETCVGGYGPGSPDSGGGPFYDAEPEDALDECGDLEPGVDTYYRLAPIMVECVDSDGDGLLDIGTAVSWDDQRTNSCASVEDAVPNTADKCRYATIDVANVTVSPGLIQVQKSAQPEQVLKPGGWVTFTFAVKNTSPDAVTLESLVDSVYGPLEQADGDCLMPQVLGPGDTYACAISAEVTGDPGIYQSVVTAWGTDSQKNPVSGTATAEVTIIGQPPPTGMGMSAAVVAGGTAAFGLALLLAGVLLRRRTA